MDQKIIKISVFLLFFLSINPATASLPRKILALYDPLTFSKPVDTPIHRHAEVWLNHLGMEVIYHPITSPLPQLSPDFRGLITWFTTFNAVKEPADYCRWLEKQIGAGKKVVILEEPGIFKTREREISSDCFKALHSLGIDYFGFYSDNPFYYEIVDKNPSMVEFERKIDLTEGLLYSLVKADPSAKVFLKAMRLDMKEGLSDLVVITPHGGFVHPSYVIYGKKELEKLHWRLNPYLFFEKAYRLEGLPRPDVTTLNGTRIFFNHIDGDGLLNLSEIDRKSYSGEVILNEVLEKRTTIPITASLITGYFDLPEFKNARVMTLYKNIFSLSHIEPASHGYAHPLKWEEEKLALKIPGYHFDPKQEIAGSVGMMTELLESTSTDQKVQLFNWTGDSRISENELSIVHQLKVPNINGGEPRFDKRFDSYAFLTPIGVRHGPFHQIYTAAPNENNYTNLWKDRFYAYREVIETFENTENPIRLKPINIYYHFYSGEKLASLRALGEVYDYALEREIFAITASEYAMLAQDFFDVAMEPTPFGYRILTQGKLRTIRFDREPRNVDMERSRGVLGFLHHQGSLYLHLDEGLSHEVYLTSAQASRPFVEKATFWIRNFRENRQKITFEKTGWHRSQITLGGLFPNQRYRIQSEKMTTSERTDSRGRLSIHFPEAENGKNFRKVLIEHVSVEN